MSRARDIADTQDNVGGAVAPFVAGKNKIINGDFGVWQRGTTITGSNGAYTADRFALNHNGTWGTNTVTRQSFTVGNEIAGYESPYFLRWTTATPSGVSYTTIDQRIEDVRTFAGQTVTFSFWAKASGTISSSPYIQFEQYFGSGGSSSVYTSSQAFTITTSWRRFTYTVAVPSITGKTIGTGSFFKIFFNIATTAFTLDTWGWQVEAGSVATPFTPAGGGFPGAELALCQRYYYRTTSSWGTNYSTTVCRAAVYFPVEMRITPTALEQSGTASDYTIGQAGGGGGTCSSVPLFSGTTARFATINGFVASGLTQFFPSYVGQANSNGFLGWSAEL